MYYKNKLNKIVKPKYYFNQLKLKLVFPHHKKQNICFVFNKTKLKLNFVLLSYVKLTGQHELEAL